MKLILDDQFRRRQVIVKFDAGLTVAIAQEAEVSLKLFTRPKSLAISPFHGIPANLLTVAIRKQGRRL